MFPLKVRFQKCYRFGIGTETQSVVLVVVLKGVQTGPCPMYVLICVGTHTSISLRVPFGVSSCLVPAQAPELKTHLLMACSNEFLKHTHTHTHTHTQTMLRLVKLLSNIKGIIYKIKYGANSMVIHSASPSIKLGSREHRCNGGQ